MARFVVDELEQRYGPPDAHWLDGAPLTTVIALILSQNTNDANSGLALQRLRVRFPDWKDAARQRPATIEKLIACAGLAGQKAAVILRTLDLVYIRKTLTLDRRKLRSTPTDEFIQTLTAIKGIGVKTAACTALFSLRRDVCPVDTHVHRLANRIGLVTTNAPDKTFSALGKLIPAGKGASLHMNLINHGRAVCKARAPRCSDCPLASKCAYYAQSAG